MVTFMGCVQHEDSCQDKLDGTHTHTHLLGLGLEKALNHVCAGCALFVVVVTHSLEESTFLVSAARYFTLLLEHSLRSGQSGGSPGPPLSHPTVSTATLSVKGFC